MTPFVGDLGAEGVFRDPAQLQVLDPRPRRDQWPQPAQILVVSGGFTVTEPELPAVAGLSDPHVRRRAPGVADLVHAFPLPQVRIGVDVHHQPPLREAEIPHPRADRVTHEAVRPVAAEHVVRPLTVHADVITGG
ncbi:hypothetical protein GCM10018954_086560 [Kutzneria kofuensis]